MKEVFEFLPRLPDFSFIGNKLCVFLTPKCVTRQSEYCLEVVNAGEEKAPSTSEMRWPPFQTPFNRLPLHPCPGLPRAHLQQLRLRLGSLGSAPPVGHRELHHQSRVVTRFTD